MSGLLLSDDLIFTSRILGTAQALGLEMRVARDPAALRAFAAPATTCIIVDLSNPGLVIEELVRESAGVRVVAYGSHVDVATLKRAREAGCDLVLPRSKFVEELPTQLAAWMKRKNEE